MKLACVFIYNIGKSIVLIGMPGVGKSTIGVILAKEIGYQFLDADLLIQEQEGMLLKDIIATKGHDGFLAVENQVNREVNAKHSVIATGGSAVYCEEAMLHYKDTCQIIYLFCKNNTNCTFSYTGHPD